MKRFEHGIQGAAPGVKISGAARLLRDNVTPTSYEAEVIADENVPIFLHFSFSAPTEGAIEVSIRHHKTDVLSSRFVVNREALPVTVERGEGTVTVKNGKMSAVIAEKPFGYRFYFDGKLLTGSGEGSAALITDEHPDADRFASTRHIDAKEGFDPSRTVRERLDLGIGETVWGLGEHFTPFVRNGQVIEAWNRDSGTKTQDAYKSVPFYLTSRGYGVFVDESGYATFDVGFGSTRHVGIFVEGGALRYTVIGGPEPLDVLRRYTALTGRAPVPPAWTFGLWLSSGWLVDVGDDVTRSLVDGMRERDIPLSVYHFDAGWMDEFATSDFRFTAAYRDPKKLLCDLHARGLHTCVWLNPYVSELSSLFEEGDENGYFLKTKDGKKTWQSDRWMPGMAVVDFTNPAAVAWYTGKIRAILDLGVDALKCDFAEDIPTDVTYFDGSDPEKMHNFYPYLYYQAMFSLLEDKVGKGNACIFGRAGTVGAQKFPVHWGGDNNANYPSMAEDLRGGLSLVSSGYSFWAHDVGGFAEKATPDLYKRWLAFGLFSTHSRLHGAFTYRVPWVYDDEASLVLSRFSKLKNTLMPYLYACACRNTATGKPLMCPMFAAYPQDRNCYPLDRQYMFGDSLLVSPVFSEDGTAEFYVPQGGVWRDLLSGEAFEGGKWYTRKYDYFSLPVLAAPGTILPVGSEDKTPEYDYTKGITFRLFGFEEGMKRTFAGYDTDRKERYTFTAEKKNGKILVTVKGDLSDFTVESDGGEEIEIKL